MDTPLSFEGSLPTHSTLNVGGGGFVVVLQEGVYFLRKVAAPPLQDVIDIQGGGAGGKDAPALVAVCMVLQVFLQCFLE